MEAGVHISITSRWSTHARIHAARKWALGVTSERGRLQIPPATAFLGRLCCWFCLLGRSTVADQHSLRGFWPGRFCRRRCRSARRPCGRGLALGTLARRGAAGRRRLCSWVGGRRCDGPAVGPTPARRRRRCLRRQRCTIYCWPGRCCCRPGGATHSRRQCPGRAGDHGCRKPADRRRPPG